MNKDVFVYTIIGGVLMWAVLTSIGWAYWSIFIIGLVLIVAGIAGMLIGKVYNTNKELEKLEG